VKTRLIAAVGEAGAALLHGAFVDDVCRLTRGVAERVLCVAGTIDHPLLVGLAAREAIPIAPQATGDLGARMSAAIAGALGTAERVCIVGTDSPALPAAHVARAFAALDDAEVVIGPAEDGGYWIVGARRPCPEIFAGVAWGTPSVLAETRALLDRHRVRYALADPFWDVDTPGDLERLARVIAADPDVAPASRAALAAWRHGRLPTGFP
jgi:rSAM/selenodomain-associated transferase 1